MTDIVQWVHDHRFTEADVLGAVAVDPYGTDGVHYYAALRFVPVPGNPSGLTTVSGEANLLVTRVRAIATAMDRVRTIPGWTGGDASAFLATTASLAPTLRRYAELLDQLGPLVEDARSVLSRGKEDAESLEHRARAALARLPGGLLPRGWGLLPDFGGLDDDAHLYLALSREARDLHGDTFNRLASIGHRIEALSALAPHPQSGFDRGVDDVVDELGAVDRSVFAAPVRGLIDAFPAEAHLAAGLLGDASAYAGTVAVDFGPGGLEVYAGAVAAGAASTMIDGRLYRTGATNAQGQEIVTRHGIEGSALSAVPIPFITQRVRGLPRVAQSIGRIARNGARGQRTVGAIAPGVPTNEPQAVGLIAGVAGVPVIPSVAGYLDDKGVGQGEPPPPPDLQLSPPPAPACAVTRR